MEFPFKVGFQISENRGFTIQCQNPHVCGEPQHWVETEGSDFVFESRRDAELAIKALADAGYDTDEKVENMPDGEFRRITCSALLW